MSGDCIVATDPRDFRNTGMFGYYETFLCPEVQKMHPINHPMHISKAVDSIPDAFQHAIDFAQRNRLKPVPKPQSVLLLVTFFERKLAFTNFHFCLIFEDENPEQIKRQFTKDSPEIRVGVIWESELGDDLLPVRPIDPTTIIAIRGNFDALMAGL